MARHCRIWVGYTAYGEMANSFVFRQRTCLEPTKVENELTVFGECKVHRSSVAGIVCFAE